MKHVMDARKAGRTYVIVGMLVLLVVCGVHYILTGKPDAPTIAYVALWGVGLLVGLGAIRYGRKLIDDGGVWTIIIDDENFTWSSPPHAMDNNFEYKLSDIAFVERRRSSKDHGSKLFRYDYFLVLKSGEEVKLHEYGFISLDNVMDELEKAGIEAKHTSMKN